MCVCVSACVCVCVGVCGCVCGGGWGCKSYISEKTVLSFHFIPYRSLQCSFVYCRCGYATLHNVLDKSQEDRMESFFLSETTKYLYLVIEIS